MAGNSPSISRRSKQSNIESNDVNANTSGIDVRAVKTSTEKVNTVDKHSSENGAAAAMSTHGVESDVVKAMQSSKRSIAPPTPPTRPRRIKDTVPSVRQKDTHLTASGETILHAKTTPPVVPRRTPKMQSTSPSLDSKDSHSAASSESSLPAKIAPPVPLKKPSRPPPQIPRVKIGVSEERSVKRLSMAFGTLLDEAESPKESVAKQEPPLALPKPAVRVRPLARRPYGAAPRIPPKPIAPKSLEPSTSIRETIPPAPLTPKPKVKPNPFMEFAVSLFDEPEDTFKPVLVSAKSMPDLRYIEPEKIVPKPLPPFPKKKHWQSEQDLTSLDRGSPDFSRFVKINPDFSKSIQELSTIVSKETKRMSKSTSDLRGEGDGIFVKYKRTEEAKKEKTMSKSATDLREKPLIVPSKIRQSMQKTKYYYLKLFKGMYIHRGLEAVKADMPAKQKIAITTHAVLSGILRGEGLGEDAATATGKDAMQLEPAYMLLKHFINRGMMFFDKLSAPYVSWENQKISLEESDEALRKAKIKAVSNRIKKLKLQVACELFPQIMTEYQLIRYIDGTVPEDSKPMSRADAIMRWWEGALSSPFTHSCSAYLKPITPDPDDSKDLLALYNDHQAMKDQVLRDTIDEVNATSEHSIMTSDGEYLTGDLLDAMIGGIYNSKLKMLLEEKS